MRATVILADPDVQVRVMANVASAFVRQSMLSAQPGPAQLTATASRMNRTVRHSVFKQQISPISRNKQINNRQRLRVKFKGKQWGFRCMGGRGQAAGRQILYLLFQLRQPFTRMTQPPDAAWTRDAYAPPTANVSGRNASKRGARSGTWEGRLAQSCEGDRFV